MEKEGKREVVDRFCVDCMCWAPQSIAALIFVRMVSFIPEGVKTPSKRVKA
jgi:hypothetical protein